MAAQAQDDDDDIKDQEDAQDVAEASEPRSNAPAPAPGTYDNNTKMGLAAIGLLTPLLGGLIGGRTGALAGAEAGATGVGNQVQNDTAFQRQLALAHQRYGLQNKLPYETRTVLDENGAPVMETYNKSTGVWSRPPEKKLAYTPQAEKNFVPAAAPAAAPTAAPDDAPEEDNTAAAAPAAPDRGPRPTDPVQGAVWDLEGKKPSLTDRDPTPQAGESIAKAEIRAKQAQADYHDLSSKQSALLARDAEAQAAEARKAPEREQAKADKEAGQSDKQETKDKNQIETDAQNLQKAMSGSRAGQGVTQNILKINAGEKIQNLLSKYPDGNVPAALMPELALGLGNLLAPGSVTEAQVHALDQQSLERDVAKKLQYFTGSPEDANTPDMVKLMGDSIDREIGVAKDQLGKHANELHGAYERLYKSDKDRFYRTIGMDASDFDKNGKYINKTIGKTGGAPADSTMMDAGDGTGAHWVPNGRVDYYKGKGAKVVQPGGQ